MTGQFFVAPDAYDQATIWYHAASGGQAPVEMLNRDLLPRGEAADQFWALVVAAVEAIDPDDIAFVLEARDLTHRHIRHLVEFDWTPPYGDEEHRDGQLVGIFHGLTSVDVDLGDDDGMLTLEPDTKVTVGPVPHA